MSCRASAPAPCPGCAHPRPHRERRPSDTSNGTMKSYCCRSLQHRDALSSACASLAWPGRHGNFSSGLEAYKALRRRQSAYNLPSSLGVLLRANVCVGSAADEREHLPHQQHVLVPKRAEL